MTGALEALLLLAAVGRRAGLRFLVQRFWMVTAGHQAFRRVTEVYLGWIGVVSFFLVHCCGAGRRGRATGEGCVPCTRRCEQQGAGCSRAVTKRASAPAAGTAGAFLARAPASQAQSTCNPGFSDCS